MRPKTWMPLLLPVLLLASVPLQAGIGRWTPFGPPLPGVSDSAFLPGALVVLSGGTVFVTRDDGESWTWIGSGLSGEPGGAAALAADPGRPGTLHLATYDGEMFRSGDSGRSWTRFAEIVHDFEHLGVHDLLVAGETIYAGTLHGLFLSRDRGATWARAGFEGERVAAIVAHPSDPRTVFLGTGTGVWKTADAGETFALLQPGGDILALAVAPSAPSTLYSGSWDGIFQASFDGGATWETRAPLGHTVASLAVDPDTPSRVYASEVYGVSVSADGGATWRSVLPSLWNGRVALDPSRPGLAYALSYNVGVAVSRDRGATWSLPRMLGLGLPPTDLVKRNPAEPGGFYVCWTRAGCRRSVDNGRTWTPFLDHARFPSPGIVDLAPDPRDPGAVYVVGRGAYRVAIDGNALVQKQLLGEPRGLGLQAVAVSGRALIVGGDSGAFRSTDGGATWKSVLSGLSVQRLIQEPDDPAVLYALAREAGGRRVVHQSTDGGTHWRRILEGSEVLAVAPSQPKILYAVRGGRVLRSRDRGATWRAQGRISADVQDLAVHPERPWILLAATDGAGVLRSQDDGRTWAAFNDGLPRSGSVRVRRVTADPEAPGRFFALPVRKPPFGGVFEARIP